MPRITDKQLIKSILESDRGWAAYALADLEPKYFHHTTWFGPKSGAPSVALVYRAFPTPVLLTVGEPRHLSSVLDEVEADLGAASEIYLVVRPELLSMIADRYRVIFKKSMLRMVLDPALFRAHANANLDARAHAPPLDLAHVNPDVRTSNDYPSHDVHTVSQAHADLDVRTGHARAKGDARPEVDLCAESLGPDDLEAIQALYRDGHEKAESPEFFTPGMLQDGFYYGIREDGALVAAAGTHVVAPSIDVAAVGNIYTRRDHRGRGLGTVVTYAVTARLVGESFSTIVLNVKTDNQYAIRLYERLGFRAHCEYYEAVAERPLPARP